MSERVKATVEGNRLCVVVQFNGEEHTVTCLLSGKDVMEGIKFILIDAVTDGLEHEITMAMHRAILANGQAPKDG